MASAKLLEIMKQVDELSVDEKLRLASHLIEKAREGGEMQPRRKWMDIHGSAPYPMVGEDAQAWISRNREESERQFSHSEVRE